MASMSQRDIMVLLVEDDPMVLELHRSFIGGIPGYRIVGSATDGRSVQKLVRTLRPDLVILDVFMPHKDGMCLFRELRNSDLPVDVILVTAAQESKTVLAARRLGAFDYILKPFRFERLLSSLENYRSAKLKLGDRSLAQHDIDRIWLARTDQSGNRELPKGINRSTLETVTSFLSRHAEGPPCSAEEVAKSLNISRITAARYLEYLETANLVSRIMDYDTGGRPKNLYVWLRKRSGLTTSTS